MTFEEFERRAEELWQRIPPEYKQGVDGLVVERETLPHPTTPDVYTLGECATEAYPSDFEGPETTRSMVILYHGSFQRLSELDPAFDWEEELWETLTHELRHHLEWLAMEDALEGVDYAADQNFQRLRDEPFDPWFYRSGEEVAPGVFKVERDFFLELEYDDASRRDPGFDFPWRGETFHVRRPSPIGDICFLWIEEGLDTGAGELTLVLVRRLGFLDRMREAFGRRTPRIVQHAGKAVSK